MLGVVKLTRLFVSDNSGARFAKCIHVYSASKQKVARAGMFVLVSLRVVLPDKKVKQGDLAKAVVVCSNDRFVRFSGYLLHTFETAVILVNTLSLLPRAKRSKGIMLEEVKASSSQGPKITALAPLVV
jgi:large subunit ribosomal protein L14